MASREIIKYDNSPLLKLAKILTPIFLAVYLVWTLLPLFIMVMASMKDLLDAFDTPAVGDWAGVAMFFDFTPTLKLITCCLPKIISGFTCSTVL